MAKSNALPRRTPSAGDITVYAGGAGDLTPEQEALIEGAIQATDLDTVGKAASHEALQDEVADRAQAIIDEATTRSAADAAEVTARNAADNLRILKTAIGAAGADGVANYDATELKLSQVLPLVINLQSAPYSAALDGTTNDATAINAAIAAASSAGGGRITCRPGRTAKVTSAIALKSNVHLDLPLTIKPTSAVTTAVFLGSSGDTVSNVTINNPAMVIDGDFSTTGTACTGIRVSNGTQVAVDGITIRNMGGAGVLLQGSGAAASGMGTTYSQVSHCKISDVGLSDGTTGFGVLVKNASSYCRVESNHIIGVKGGMGVGANDSEGLGFPLHLSFNDNTISMVPSNTGFEAIGLTAGCDFATINNNNIYNSQDNGISVSCSYSTCIGNVINGTLNHGIDSSGTGNVIANNVIRNVGRQDSLDYGGISISSASYCVIMGNRIVETATTGNRMAFGIKGITSAGGNRITFNIASGYRLGYVSTLHATDFVIDDVTNTDGFTFNKAHFGTIYGADSSTALIVGSGFRMNGVNFSGSTTYGPAQLNAQTNVPASRPSLAALAISGQVADPFQVVFRNTTTSVETVMAKANTDGEYEVTTAGKGVILKSPDGTRYRLTVANGGAISTTAL